MTQSRIVHLDRIVPTYPKGKAARGVNIRPRKSAGVQRDAFAKVTTKPHKNVGPARTTTSRAARLLTIASRVWLPAIVPSGYAQRVIPGKGAAPVGVGLILPRHITSGMAIASNARQFHGD